MKRMTYKELIDFCNSTPWYHCKNGECEHQKECDAYGLKYDGSIPACDDWTHPERYTDEEIVIEQELEDSPAGSGEPSEEDDLISRTAAINEARWVNTDGGRFEVVHIETLLTLPAIKTEHVGHWINDGGPLKCSECGTSFPDLYPDYEKSVACPHCGAPMRGERDV